jgi:undecaprenyl-diphosphatase
MVDFLYSIDKAVFYFCNQTIANPVFDVVMPFLTDLNKSVFGQIFFIILWLLLMWKGGKKGRIIGILVIPLIVMSDQLSSSVIKKIVARPRPCHDIDGVPILDHIHLLVPCGSGYSFPSSHAVNNFAVGTFLSFYYRRWTWAFMSFAFVIAFSRLSVGVHYPSDCLGGAIIGALCAVLLIMVWNFLSRNYPILAPENPPSDRPLK